MGAETSTPVDSLSFVPTTLTESVEIVKHRSDTSETEDDCRNNSDSEMDEVPSTPRNADTDSNGRFLFAKSEHDIQERKCWGEWLVERAPFSYLQRTPLLTASPSSSVTSIETSTSIYLDDQSPQKKLDTTPMAASNEVIGGENFPNHCLFPQLPSTKMNIYVADQGFDDNKSIFPALPDLKDSCSDSRRRCRSEPMMDMRADATLPKAWLPARRERYVSVSSDLLQQQNEQPLPHDLPLMQKAHSFPTREVTASSGTLLQLLPKHNMAASSKRRHVPPLPQSRRLQRAASESNLPLPWPSKHRRSSHIEADNERESEKFVASNRRQSLVRLLPRANSDSSLRRRRRLVDGRCTSGDFVSEHPQLALQSFSAKNQLSLRPRRGSADSVHEPFSNPIDQSAEFVATRSKTETAAKMQGMPDQSPCLGSGDDQSLHNDNLPVVYCYPEDDDPILTSPSFCGVMGLSAAVSPCLSATPEQFHSREQDISNLVPLHLSCQRENLFQQALAQESQGNLFSALECYEQSLHWINAGGGTQLDTATVYHKIGVVRWKMGAYEESLRVLTLSLHAFEQILECSVHNDTMIMHCPNGNAQIFADILISFGRVFLSLGDYRKAWRHFERSVHIVKCLESSFTSCSDSFLPILARALHGLGMVDETLGRYSCAMNYLKEALRLQRSRCTHTDFAATLLSMGGVEEKCGHYHEAMVCYKQALVTYRSDLDSSPVDVGVTLTSIGWVHYVWGEFDLAMQAYSDALRIMKAVLGENHRNVASIMFQIGMIYCQEGRISEALDTYKDVLLSQKRALGPEHLDIAITLDSISAAYEKTQQYERAAAFLSRSLRIRCNALGKRHLYVGMTLERLGHVHAKIGDLGVAEMCYLDALRVYEAKKLGQKDSKVRRLHSALQEIDEWRQREVNRS